MRARLVALVTAEGTLCWYSTERAACAHSPKHGWTALDLWTKLEAWG